MDSQLHRVCWISLQDDSVEGVYTQVIYLPFHLSDFLPQSKLNVSEGSTFEDRTIASRLKLGLFSYPVLQAADILIHRYSLLSWPAYNYSCSTDLE